MTEKVVKFPTSRIVRENVNSEILKEAEAKSIRKYADGITDAIIVEVLLALETAGIDLDTSECQIDLSYVANFLRGAIYRNFKLEHPTHTIMEENRKLFTPLLEKPKDDDG